MILVVVSSPASRGERRRMIAVQNALWYARKGHLCVAQCRDNGKANSWNVPGVADVSSVMCESLKRVCPKPQALAFILQAYNLVGRPVLSSQHPASDLQHQLPIFDFRLLLNHRNLHTDHGSTTHADAARHTPHRDPR